MARTDCTVFQEDLKAYSDGELASARRAQVEAHLAQCPSCRAELHSYEQIAVNLRDWEGVSAVRLSPELRNRVLHEINTPSPPAEEPWWRQWLRPSPWMTWGGVGAVATAAVVTFLSFQFQKSLSPLPGETASAPPSIANAGATAQTESQPLADSTESLTINSPSASAVGSSMKSTAKSSAPPSPVKGEVGNRSVDNAGMRKPAAKERVPQARAEGGSSQFQSSVDASLTLKVQDPVLVAEEITQLVSRISDATIQGEGLVLTMTVPAQRLEEVLSLVKQLGTARIEKAPSTATDSTGVSRLRVTLNP
jgi:hypothetical protein